MKKYGRIINLVVNMVLLWALVVSCGGGGGGAYSTSSPAPAFNQATLNPATLKADGYYFNVHSTAFPDPDGEIRGQIHVDPAATGTVTITTPLSGAQEVPPNNSAGTGTGTLTVDLATGTATNISVNFSGLSGTATAAHIHEAPVGVNGPVVVPINLSSPVPVVTPMPIY